MEMVNDENCAPEENGHRESNLMLLTKSRRADIAELQETLHTVKPEQDPFWEARGKERTEKLVHNSVTEAIKARAKSRLYESTTAHKASTRVKAYDEKEYAGRREIPEASNESTFLIPTAAFRHKKDTEPEVSESAELLTERKLHEFGHTRQSFNRNPIQGTAGFGLASKEAPHTSRNQDKKLTQPQVSERLLLSTAASKLNKFHDDERTAQKAAETAAEEAARLRRVKSVSTESEFLRPTTAYIQHHTSAPEPDSAYEGVVSQGLTTFGKLETYNTKSGTAGFGLGSSKPGNSSSDNTTGRDGTADDDEDKRSSLHGVSDRLLLGTYASKLHGYAAYQAHQERKMTRTPGKKRHVANIASAVYTQKTAAMIAMKKKPSPQKVQKRRRYSFAPKMYSWGDNPVPKSLKTERRDSMPAPAPAHAPVMQRKTQRWAVKVVESRESVAAAPKNPKSPATAHTPQASHSRKPVKIAVSSTSSSSSFSVKLDEVHSSSEQQEEEEVDEDDGTDIARSASKQVIASHSFSPPQSQSEASPEVRCGSAVSNMNAQMSPSSPTPTPVPVPASEFASEDEVSASKTQIRDSDVLLVDRRRSSGVFGRSPMIGHSPVLHINTAPLAEQSTHTSPALASMEEPSPQTEEQELELEEGQEQEELVADAVDGDNTVEPSVEQELRAWENANLNDEPEPEARADEAEHILEKKVEEESRKRSRRASSSSGDTLAGLGSLLQSNIALEILETETERSMNKSIITGGLDKEREEAQEQEDNEEHDEVTFQLQDVIKKTPRAKKAACSSASKGRKSSSGKKAKKTPRSPATPLTPKFTTTFSSILGGAGAGAGPGSGSGKKERRSAAKIPIIPSRRLTPVREVYQPNQLVTSHHGIDLDNITQEIAHLLVDSPLVPAYEKAAADVSMMTPPSPTNIEQIRVNLRSTASEAAHNLSSDINTTKNISSSSSSSSSASANRTPPASSVGTGRRESMVPELDLSPLSPALHVQTRASARLAAAAAAGGTSGVGIITGTSTPPAIAEQCRSSSSGTRGKALTPTSGGGGSSKTRKSPRSSTKKGQVAQ